MELPSATSSLISPENTVDNVSAPHTSTSSSLPIRNSRLSTSIANDVAEFYGRFEDESEQIFADISKLTPSVEDLCRRARSLLRLCCSQRYSSGEIKALDHHGTQLKTGCDSSIDFFSQFPSAESFLRCVLLSRRHFLRSEGWRRVKIRTESGLNVTGVYRKLLPIITEQVRLAGGLSAVKPFAGTRRNGRRVFFKVTDSDAMHMYSDALTIDAPIVCLDLHSDGTTLAKNGSQSACVLRMRLANVYGSSNLWFDVGIAPALSVSTTYSDPNVASERSELLQRYLYVALGDVISASKSGFLLMGKLHFVRITTLVCDQKMERSFLSLKAAGSFKDCTFCTMPSRGCVRRDGQ